MTIFEKNPNLEPLLPRIRDHFFQKWPILTIFDRRPNPTTRRSGVKDWLSKIDQNDSNLPQFWSKTLNFDLFWPKIDQKRKRKQKNNFKNKINFKSACCSFSPILPKNNKKKEKQAKNNYHHGVSRVDPLGPATCYIYETRTGLKSPQRRLQSKFSAFFFFAQKRQNAKKNKKKNKNRKTKNLHHGASHVGPLEPRGMFFFLWNVGRAAADLKGPRADTLPAYSTRKIKNSKKEYIIHFWPKPLCLT